MNLVWTSGIKPEHLMQQHDKLPYHAKKILYSLDRYHFAGPIFFVCKQSSLHKIHLCLSLQSMREKADFSVTKETLIWHQFFPIRELEAPASLCYLSPVLHYFQAPLL